MPSHEEHCQDSLRRYGKAFSELHRWMDEPSTILGPNHRKYRHDPNTTPKIAMELFGPLADQACLDHIRLDELETRRKSVKDRKTIKITWEMPRKPRTPSPLEYGFYSLLSFIIGLLIISHNWAIAIVFFAISFLGFLVFIGALLEMSKKEAVSPSTIHTGIPTSQIEPHKICPNCGTKFEANLETCPKCGKELKRRESKQNQ